MLGLVMLVRDEAEMLPKTLPSMLDIVERAVIIDTGSVDDTTEIIGELGGVGGNVAGYGLEWKGFAATRTEAFELACNTFSEISYWLFLDADMLVEAELPLPDLDRDAYYIQLPGPFRMSLPLLLKAGLPWRWEGAAHSYLVWPDNATSAELTNIKLYEQRKNSPREDKFKADLTALENELDPRTVFYFAQTLRDLGHPKEAADAYRFRIRLSSESPQDVYWSCYQEGLLRLETEGLAAATPVLLEAWSRRPTRAESLWLLAREYRLAGQPHAAVMFAQQAAELEMPTDRGFVLAWIYEWGALMELALAERAAGELYAARDVFVILRDRGTDVSVEGREFAEAQLRELDILTRHPLREADSAA